MKEKQPKLTVERSKNPGSSDWATAIARVLIAYKKILEREAKESESDRNDSR